MGLIKFNFNSDFYKGEEGKFTDKNGKLIQLGDKAVVTDRNGKKWYGEIVKQTQPTVSKNKDGSNYHNFLAFKANYNITLWQYWTEKKLEVIKNISRYEFMNNEVSLTS